MIKKVVLHYFPLLSEKKKKKKTTYMCNVRIANVGERPFLL